jgi:hypothetical protein
MLKAGLPSNGEVLGEPARKDAREEVRGGHDGRPWRRGFSNRHQSNGPSAQCGPGQWPA